MTEPQCREAICYVENCAQFRELNAQMNRVPALAMTLTGGLWFGAGATENLDVAIRFGLLILAGFSNLALILIAYRIRYVMESYLDRIEKFHLASFAGGSPRNPGLPWLGSYSMIAIFCAFMLLAALLSFIGAFWKYWPLENCISLWWGVAALIILLIGMYFLISWLSWLMKDANAVGGENA